MENKKNGQIEKTEYEKINKRRRVQIFFNDESLTQQNLEGETNINNIVKKYQVTGELPEQRQGFYGDVTEIPDYQTSLQIVKRAQESFNTLPAKLRAEFNNDPGAMISWLEDPNNRAKAVELGLLGGDTPKKEAEPPIQKKEEIKSQETK